MKPYSFMYSQIISCETYTKNQGSTDVTRTIEESDPDLMNLKGSTVITETTEPADPDLILI